MIFRLLEQGTKISGTRIKDSWSKEQGLKNNYTDPYAIFIFILSVFVPCSKNLCSNPSKLTN
jgi:hypothetical protein